MGDTGTCSREKNMNLVLSSNGHPEKRQFRDRQSFNLDM